MARNISPDSVSSKVADLTLGEHLRLNNPYTSVMVMVSNLKKKEAHKDKLFKIKATDNVTIVTRIK
jgi:pectate lyase